MKQIGVRDEAKVLGTSPTAAGAVLPDVPRTLAAGQHADGEGPEDDPGSGKDLRALRPAQVLSAVRVRRLHGAACRAAAQRRPGARRRPHGTVVSTDILSQQVQVLLAEGERVTVHASRVRPDAAPDRGVAADRRRAATPREAEPEEAARDEGGFPAELEAGEGDAGDAPAPRRKAPPEPGARAGRSRGSWPRRRGGRPQRPLARQAARVAPNRGAGEAGARPPGEPREAGASPAPRPDPQREGSCGRGRRRRRRGRGPRGRTVRRAAARPARMRRRRRVMNLGRKLREIVARDPRFKVDAYEFVFRAWTTRWSG